MTTAPSQPSAHDNPAVEHETTDVNVRGILGFGLGLLAVGVAIHVIVWLLFLYFSNREATRTPAQYPLAAGQQTRLPPEPRLQTNPREDLRALRAREDDILNGYSWVDRPAGIVRIPIEEAMKLTVERGFPVRKENNAGR
jgi:hypothetical protein